MRSTSTRSLPPANQLVSFHEISTGNFNLMWSLKDPSDQAIFNQTLGQCGPDVGVLVLGPWTG
ncbi:MAG: hypothetical protein SGJ09_02685 [Phycisphaerae bacterium]|nr:hypothetical protein [Phycisphaerae bacterium]